MVNTCLPESQKVTLQTHPGLGPVCAVSRTSAALLGPCQNTATAWTDFPCFFSASMNTAATLLSKTKNPRRHRSRLRACPHHRYRCSQPAYKLLVSTKAPPRISYFLKPTSFSILLFLHILHILHGVYGEWRWEMLGCFCCCNSHAVA